MAERFELYIGGVELCNGYHEITDANELTPPDGEPGGIASEENAYRRCPSRAI